VIGDRVVDSDCRDVREPLASIFNRMEATMSDGWTTQVPPELTRPYGVEEVHSAFFTPAAWPGQGNVVNLLIPECETQYVFWSEGGEPLAVVNRPKENRDVEDWLRHVCETAKELKAMLVVSCDTREQADLAVRRVAKLAPGYARQPLERVRAGKTGPHDLY
jgi:hypothetical protein